MDRCILNSANKAEILFIRNLWLYESEKNELTFKKYNPCCSIILFIRLDKERNIILNKMLKKK